MLCYNRFDKIDVITSKFINCTFDLFQADVEKLFTSINEIRPFGIKVLMERIF